MAKYSLFVLKVPLNTNKPSNQPTNHADEHNIYVVNVDFCTVL